MFQKFDRAIQAWRDVLGDEYVVTSQERCGALATTTFKTTQSVRAILYPACRKDVQACLRIANQYHIAIYPVSSGRNWGYGSSVPCADQNVVMHLGRMNRIIDFDAKQATITVEPGVSQQMAYNFLQKERANLWLDVTGGSAACSLIGNTLERGFGHTPYGDHFAHVCNLGIVLPTGEYIHTGFGRFDGAKTKQCYRWGVGPFWDGMFTQSNFGVVTSMTFWLMPAPECFEAFYFSVTRRESLPVLIDALQPLRLNRTIDCAVHIANNYKVINAYRQYPWEESRGHSPLSQQVLDDIWNRFDFGTWNGSGGLYGTKAQVKEAKRLIRKALKGKVKTIKILNDKRIEFLKRYPSIARRLSGMDVPTFFRMLEPVYHLKKGIPTDEAVATTYWRKKIPVPDHDPHPDRDRCGLIWIAPIVPLDGKHAQCLSEIAYDIVLGHDFEPMISMTIITERALDCVIGIIYDRDVKGEDEKAMRCHDALLERFVHEGYYPYRLGLQGMDKLPDVHPDQKSFYRKIKKALDPNGILAPGRYEF